ncbi:MAG: STAS domain-containing protein [Kiritimatiellae bacterium]|nr:STAS domain-containing protein [Kiritimatiellia bacterium]MDD4735118.1 STAS domain-containing protein [Kiritimatiellia bacterium]
MKVEVIERAGGLILKVSGVVDSFSTGLLESECRQLMQRDVKTMVVDLQETEFLGSSAICHLVGLGKEVRKRNGVFYVSPNSHVRKVLKMGGVDDLFPLVRNPDRVLSA